MTESGLYLSAPHDCPYIPGQTAMTLVVDPRTQVERPLFELSMRYGFRRSGEMIYRPHCPSCSQCESVRVPVNDFIPSRSQKRTWRRNQDLCVERCPPVFTDEHFELYLRYQTIRHPDGPMINSDPEQCLNFLKGPADITSFYEVRLQNTLVAVAVVDRLSDALSGVYTFYDPTFSRRSIGVFAILWEIEQTKRLGCQWLYLGYWIKQCSKMAYKINFRPVEHFRDGDWRRLSPLSASLPSPRNAAS
ncbi:MAG: arginyltransferase [Gammaproteobacteria bacterium]|nr:arginyltransferase [Gammaproteobacteria bacterium]